MFRQPSAPTMPFDLERYDQLRSSRELGALVRYVEESATTMDDARGGLDGGDPCGTAYVAGYMTAGRGRAGRRWTYPAGRGLHVTYALCLEGAGATHAGLLPVAAALATAEAIEATCGLRPEVKWPNDLLAEGRKFVGILVESRVRGGRFEAFAGVGVNTREPDEWPPDLEGSATSIEGEGFDVPDRETLLAALSGALEMQVARLSDDPTGLVEDWRGRLITIGQRVRFDAAGAVLEGVAEGVGAGGELLLRRDDGAVETVVAGDVTTIR
jgi:BirA family biotin operon repressor/biotin-[acetyl-CoA-carboxylase] ligase